MNRRQLNKKRNKEKRREQLGLISDAQKVAKKIADKERYRTLLLLERQKTETEKQLQEELKILSHIHISSLCRFKSNQRRKKLLSQLNKLRRGINQHIRSKQ